MSVLSPKLASRDIMGRIRYCVIYLNFIYPFPNRSIPYLGIIYRRFPYLPCSHFFSVADISLPVLDTEISLEIRVMYSSELYSRQLQFSHTLTFDIRNIECYLFAVVTGINAIASKYIFGIFPIETMLPPTAEDAVSDIHIINNQPEGIADE